MTALRPLLAGPASCLVLLLLTAPSVAADLAVNTRSGATFDIYTSGSSTLAAPQNVTIDARWSGYFLTWKAPSTVGDTVVSYTLYRVPAPGTDGALKVFYVGRSTVFYDRPAAGDFVYFVTAVFGNAGESIPGRPVATIDVASNYPHCGVVGVYSRPPYYESHLGCLFPLPG